MNRNNKPLDFLSRKVVYHICGMFKTRNTEESKGCHRRHTELYQGLTVKRKPVSDTDLEGIEWLMLVSS